MLLQGTLRSVWVLMDLMKVFLPFLSWLTSTRMIPFTPSHQQASFHLPMRRTVMSEAESHIPPSLPPFSCPPYTCCFSSVHLTSLINTRAPYTALYPPPPTTLLPLPLPCVDLSNLADCTPWAYSAESNASVSLFGSRSSAPVRSHSHLACLSEMGLSGIPTLPFIQRGNWKWARKGKYTKEREMPRCNLS